VGLRAGGKLASTFRDHARVVETLAVDGVRRYEGRMNDSAKFLTRILLAIILAPLAGCAGGNSSADLAPAAPAQGQPAAAPAPAQSAPPRSAQVTGPVVRTPEKIKADCWMRYEEDKKVKNIDQRLALVEKCIDEASRAQGPQRN